MHEKKPKNSRRKTRNSCRLQHAEMSSMRLALKMSLAENSVTGTTRSGTPDGSLFEGEFLKPEKKRRKSISTDDSKTKPSKGSDDEQSLASSDRERPVKSQRPKKASASREKEDSATEASERENSPLNNPEVEEMEETVTDKFLEVEAVCEKQFGDDENEVRTAITTAISTAVSTAVSSESSTMDVVVDQIDSSENVEQSAEDVNTENVDNEANEEIVDGDEKKSDEPVKEKKPKKKRRKMAEALADFGVLLPGDLDADNKLVKYTSPRAAALVAKTKLAIKPLRGPNSANAASVVAGAVATSTSTTAMETGKGRPNKESKELLEEDLGKSANKSVDESGEAKKKIKGRPTKSVESAAESLVDRDPEAPSQTDQLLVEEEASRAEWVQCDACSKWRRVPSSVDTRQLPDQWYCSMITWISDHQGCQTPADDGTEEAAETPATVRRKNRVAVSLPSRNKSDGAEADTEGAGGRVAKTPVRNKRPVSRAALAPSSEVKKDDSDDEAAPNVSQFRRRPMRQVSGASAATVGGAVGGVETEKVNWVQCNKCSKWRKVPSYIDAGSLPEVWVCTQNTWAPLFARCSAKQESDNSSFDGTDAAATGLLPDALANATTAEKLLYGAAVADAASAVKSRKQVFPPPVPGSRTPSVPTPGPDGLPVKKITQWVQCERRNCKKWRKLPAWIDSSTLPEKWFCEMNIWDPDRATCDGPEETDSEDEQQHHGAAARSQLILANSKGPGALSYRRIIFGNDGRLRPAFNEKNRNGYGLFSFCESVRPAEGDDYVEPTKRLSYWFSSAYDDRGSLVSASGAGKKTSAGNPKKLTFEVDGPSPDPAPIAVNNLCPTERKPSEYSCSYLLQAAQRFSSKIEKREHQSQSGFAWPKKDNPKFHLLENLTLFQRMELECVAVRSCLSLYGEQPITVNSLFQLLCSSYFHDPKLEACRFGISTVDSLVDILRRLEECGDVEMTLGITGETTVQLVWDPALRPPVERRRGSSELDSEESPPQISSSAVLASSSPPAPLPGYSRLKTGLPVKLRKFRFQPLLQNL